MPEGPEVREYFLYIEPLLREEKITNIEVLSGKYKTKIQVDNIERVKEVLILDVLLKGKSIFIKCEKNICITFVHGMTGYYSEKKEKHSRIVLHLYDKKLYYNDPRNFGTITITITPEGFDKIYNSLGPDVLKDNISYEDFFSKLNKKPKLQIGSSLLDQKLICGIGNYLRCDILWYCKIHHERTIGSLSEEEKNKLYLASINITRFHANLSYELEYEPETEFFVYMQEEDMFGNLVKRDKYKGRTIHYVDW
jgi:formamidopyrimidine-DNA glycosylase